MDDPVEALHELYRAVKFAVHEYEVATGRLVDANPSLPQDVTDAINKTMIGMGNLASRMRQTGVYVADAQMLEAMGEALGAVLANHAGGQ